MHYIFSGPMLEKWMVKVVCGFIYSRIAHTDKASMIETHSFDKRMATNALLGGDLCSPAGLSLLMPLGLEVTTDDKLDVRMLTMDLEPRVIGSQIRLRNHGFEIIVDGRGVQAKSAAEGRICSPFRANLHEQQTLARREPLMVSERLIQINHDNGASEEVIERPTAPAVGTVLVSEQTATR